MTQLCEFGFVGGRQCRRADHRGAAVFRREPCAFDDAGRRKIDDGISPLECACEVGRDRHARIAAAGHRAGVLPEERGFGVFDRSRKFERIAFLDIGDQPAAHAARGSDDDGSDHDIVSS